jgi:redox-sensitive bicupin YhaK (pirin superfamily)
MSFVLEGKIKHFDTKLNAWKELSEGDVQIIRAGNGISHSEFMEEGSRMFQIWLDPDLQKTLSQEATYDDYQKSQFPTKTDGSAQITTLIGEGSPLTLDAEGVISQRIKIEESPYVHQVSKDKSVGVYILSGSFKVNNQESHEDEFIMINEAEEVRFEGVGEIFLFSTPTKLSYQPYIALIEIRTYNLIL